MMKFPLRFLTLLLLTSVVGLGWARGRSEAIADVTRDESALEQNEADEPAPVVIPAEPVAMDEETASLLFSIGLMPFQKKIPSENFVVQDLDGREAQLADYYGEVVFLNFWATWCPPCREEMPSMQKLHEALDDEGLAVVAVNVQEGVDLVRPFIEENKFTFPVLLDRDGRVSLRYSVRAFPTTYIIDRSGNVLGVRPGYHDWSSDEVVAGFRALLAR